MVPPDLCFGTLSAYYSEASGAASVDQLEVNTARLMAKIRTIAAFSYKKSIGQPFIYPQDKLAYCANFLNMMFAVPAEPERQTSCSENWHSRRVCPADK